MVCHILLESSQQRLQLYLNFHLNQRFAKEVMSLQSVETPNFGNFGTPNLGVLGQNDIWMQPLWLIIENTIKGKEVASPKFKSWWVLWVCGLFVHQKCSNHTLINLLFGLCRSMWIIDLLVTRPSPRPRALAHPSSPKVLRTREHTPTFSSSVVFIFGFTFESLKECGGVSHGIRAPTKFNPPIGEFWWHRRRPVSQYKRPWWKNPPKT